ncbi:MAG: hypothetical protein P9C36_12535 [Defluviicoccus sp.]|nr:hypothetical protein [Defluviicoccus sp.]MDG4593440.1 hypothetical protein [Defluviicoccus sp.]
MIPRVLPALAVAILLPGAFREAGAGEGDGQSTPCLQRYREVVSFQPAPADVGRAPLDVLAPLTPHQPFAVEANLSIRALAGPIPVALHVRYPEGSINPGSKDTPAGGAQFYAPLLAGSEATAACLGYRVRFEDGFAFARGGKLPGLFGSEGAPVTTASGCRPVHDQAGFSARLMWRSGGRGEVYAYTQNKTARCGESLGRGNWTYATGPWIAIEEEVILNTPGHDDGRVRVWIDGRLVLDQGGLVYRSGPAVHIQGLFFSTFFGGKKPDWASPRDQGTDFADFRLGLPR